MPKVSEVCSHVRSKNAGPFWLTVDMTFLDAASFDRYSNNAALQPAALAPLFNVDARQIKRFVVPDLKALKISYPRCHPQGGVHERDMHGGQQYVQLLDLEL